MLEHIRADPVFPSDNGRRWRITELYLPYADIRQLGLPVLNWPQRIDTGDGTFVLVFFSSPTADSIPEQLLTRLGFLRHPSLHKIIEIFRSDDPKLRDAAFRYLSSKFDEVYHAEYDPSKFEDIPFIPAVKDGKDCVGSYEEVRPCRHFVEVS